MTQRVPELILERYALGELPPPRMEEVRERLEAEPGGLERLEALSASNTEILNQYPERWFGGVIANRQWRNPGRNRSLMVAIPVLAMAAIALLVVGIPQPTNVVNPEAEEIIFVKGDARLTVYRQENGEQVKLRPKDFIGEGDLIQLRYVPVGMSFGAVYSVDGRGEVTRHLPLQGDQAAELDNRATRLAKSYELDDAPGFERFVFVTSHEPFSLEEVRVAVDQIAANPDDAGTAELELPDYYDYWSVTLTKEER